jgi:hypothetical protein
MKKITEEDKRLASNAEKMVPIENWGPYLSERQWGTVREDYSEDGMAWPYFPFDHASKRAYRWGEDGIGGISDLRQNLCFAFSFWNGKDPILKERLFGLSNPEGNHGEDVKELYYFLDNTPTHSYMKFLYKYPQGEYPYQKLRDVNAQVGKNAEEFELLDTGLFDQSAYFDIYIEYAKKSSDDISIQATVINRGDSDAQITLVPTLWFRNTWLSGEVIKKPQISLVKNQNGTEQVNVSSQNPGEYYLYYENADRVLFTENETNTFDLYDIGRPNQPTKDLFNRVIINHEVYDDALISGTKCGVVFSENIAAKSQKVFKLRLSSKKNGTPFGTSFDSIINQRKVEADAYFESLSGNIDSVDKKAILRQAIGGLLWSKQYYQYDVEKWLKGDPGQISPPLSRYEGRNKDWKHLKIADIMSMPDTWEYPWFAAWDLAFHCIPLAMVDPVFAKNQLILLTREWFMSPNGQIPAYEWNFSDLNPPILAWSGFNVYKIEKELHGKNDIDFLKRLFQKLIVNFTWWLNREDVDGNTLFTGGFMGLDNISVIDRSKTINDNTSLEQADATSWMGLYALNMLEMAHEISKYDKSYEDMVIRFYEHYCLIAEALNDKGLWDNQDNFFYDVLKSKSGESVALKVRSIVGLISLFGVTVLERNTLDVLNDFSQRIKWFKRERKKENQFLPIEEVAENGDILISLLSKEKLQLIVNYLVNENEFLSVGGLRALSKVYKEKPYMVTIGGSNYTIDYERAESTNDLFGGNSNWRGPVWFPINYLILKSIKKIGNFYGDKLTVEYPNGSGTEITCIELYKILAARLVSIFEIDNEQKRPVHGRFKDFYAKDENKDLLLFYEYFDGDDAHGVGASHQTGWTALVAELLSDII